MGEPAFVITKSLRGRGAPDKARPCVHVQAVVEPRLRDFLTTYFPHEVLLQKPVLFGAMPIDMHRSRSGLPENTHLIEFLKGGDTIVITVQSLIRGYTFSARTIWDAIAFEVFAETAFQRFEVICRHARAYRPAERHEDDD